LIVISLGDMGRNAPFFLPWQEFLVNVWKHFEP